VLGFDLTPDREADEEQIRLSLQGNLRFEARFKKPVTDTVTCIVFAEFPGNAEFNNSRNVTIE
jgi:hypothetical protein